VIAEIPVPVEEWRRLARAAARALGRPVQTVIVQNVEVAAVLRDWPATPDEQATHWAAMRRAIDRF